MQREVVWTINVMASLCELTQTHPALTHGGPLGAQTLPGRIFVNKQVEKRAGPLPCWWVDEPLAAMPLPKNFFVEYPWLSGAIQTFLQFGNRHPLGVPVALTGFPLLFLGPSVWSVSW